MNNENTYPTIEQVIFCYTGTDEDYTDFLKAIIHDYISDQLNDYDEKAG